MLSDWIHRLETGDSSGVDDQAVWLPLYRIGGVLETTLPQIYAADYAAQLEAARARLIAKFGIDESTTGL